MDLILQCQQKLSSTRWTTLYFVIVEKRVRFLGVSSQLIDLIVISLARGVCRLEIIDQSCDNCTPHSERREGGPDAILMEHLSKFNVWNWQTGRKERRWSIGIRASLHPAFYSHRARRGFKWHEYKVRQQIMYRVLLTKKLEFHQRKFARLSRWAKTCFFRVMNWAKTKSTKHCPRVAAAPCSWARF